MRVLYAVVKYVVSLFIFSLLFTCCQEHSFKNNEMSNHLYTNLLINETSPYLLQHAHNPVNWYPWGQEALQKAKEENKLLLISVGYAACHWCHVMEHESFEDSAVAEVMNKHFVCIKVDREERPDIDQVYMNAVQLMTGKGGWPLNCFALPDGRPIYGGTYFKQNHWVEVLQKLAYEYAQNPEKVEEYANRLTQGVREYELIETNTTDQKFSRELLDEVVAKWKSNFGNKEGGANHAPKFPLPNNYTFLMRYAALSYNDQVDAHVQLTLDKMAFGGIYDQIGGGFARYSVDGHWKVPHFEKMLYDNSQLISLYAEAYARYKKPLYKEVVYQTIAFCKRELSNQKGIYYSSLDADSEGREGAFYVWSSPLFDSICGIDAPLMKAYYNVDGAGLWENNENILLRQKSDAELAHIFGISEKELNEIVQRNKEKLFKHRAKRIHPGLDDKSLTSWNALHLKGLVDAYRVFGEEEFLDEAKKIGQFITSTQIQEIKGLYHSFKNNKSTINGFLEDYAFAIEALTSLYQVTFNEKWLNAAEHLAHFSINHFKDTESGLFYFTSDMDAELVVRKIDFTDNVMPSSNSALANGLFFLGTILANDDFVATSKQMLHNIQPYMANYGSGFSHWGNFMLTQVYPFYEVAIVGDDWRKKQQEMGAKYYPNMLFIGSEKSSSLSLLSGKGVKGKTMIYVCENKSCQLPTSNAVEAIKLLK